MASISFGSSSGFDVLPSALPGMVTCCLAPLEPSIIVTVLDPGGGASTGFAAVPDAPYGEVAKPSWRACCLPSLSPSRAVADGGTNLVATTAVGSPPSGSFTKAAHATTTIPESPSTGHHLRCGNR